MKRKFGLLALALTLAMSLCACGNSTSEHSPAPSAPAVAPSDSPNTEKSRTRTGVTGTDAWDDAIHDAGDVIRGDLEGMDDMVDDMTGTQWNTAGTDRNAAGIPNGTAQNGGAGSAWGSAVPGEVDQWTYNQFNGNPTNGYYPAEW